MAKVIPEFQVSCPDCGEPKLAAAVCEVCWEAPIQVCDFCGGDLIRGECRNERCDLGPAAA